MSENVRNDQNRNNQYQGQDEARDNKQPGQAGGNLMPENENTRERQDQDHNKDSDGNK